MSGQSLFVVVVWPTRHTQRTFQTENGQCMNRSLVTVRPQCLSGAWNLWKEGSGWLHNLNNKDVHCSFITNNTLIGQGQRVQKRPHIIPYAIALGDFISFRITWDGV